MTAFGARAALTAVLLLASLPAAASAAPPQSGPMPAKPKFGAPATQAMPPLSAVPPAASVGGLPAARLRKSLNAVLDATEPPTRGAHEQRLYARSARSVVLIIAPDGTGSGAVIDANGTIVTNWHVAGGYKTVGVIFKPTTGDGAPRIAEAVEAKVLFVDEIADLALIKVDALPADVKPLKLGDHTQLSVGANVHAIGHPIGEAWSYTQGTVSQIRPDYEWQPEGGIVHRADVIQTQTPINPGNSGGPLLNDAGEIVGINAFGYDQAQLINFAVAATEIRRFVALRANRLAPPRATASEETMPQTALPAAQAGTSACPVAKLESRRSSLDDATGHLLDTNCDGVVDTILVVPDSNRAPVELLVDANQNEATDAVYVDEDHDFKFDYVLIDTDEDGSIDLIGTNLDRDLKPTRILAAKA